MHFVHSVTSALKSHELARKSKEVGDTANVYLQTIKWRHTFINEVT